MTVRTPIICHSTVIKLKRASTCQISNLVIKRMGSFACARKQLSQNGLMITSPPDDLEVSRRGRLAACTEATLDEAMTARPAGRGVLLLIHAAGAQGPDVDMVGSLERVLYYCDAAGDCPEDMPATSIQPGIAVNVFAVVGNTAQAPLVETPSGLPDLAPSPASAAAANLTKRSCSSFSNPVIAHDFADPSSPILGDDNYLYVFATNAFGRNIQVARTLNSDIGNWELMDQDALPVLPSWAGRGRVWAPEVAKIDGQYVMYYTARYRQLRLQCTSIATSDDIAGPYNDTSSTPILCPSELGGAIDPYQFQDTDGQRYLFYKSDGNAVGQIPYIWVQPLTIDGLNLVGQRIQLFGPSSNTWEGSVVEAPSVNLCDQQSSYCLFYSANNAYGPSYAVGLAIADNITGPYIKSSTNPVLTSNRGNGINGPGGQSFVQANGEASVAVFHSWDSQVYNNDTYWFRPMSLAVLSTNSTANSLRFPDPEFGVSSEYCSDNPTS